MLPVEGATDGQLAEVIAWSGTVLRQPKAAVAATYDVVVDVVIVIAGIALIAFALALYSRARHGEVAPLARRSLVRWPPTTRPGTRPPTAPTQRCNAKPIV